MWLRNVKILRETIQEGDVYIADGKICDIVSKAHIQEDSLDYDGKGFMLLPSFLDMHCHLRDPGLTQKEDLETGQRAALSGGFTTICAMANTKPVVDEEQIIVDILHRAQALSLAEVIQIGAVTKNFSEEFVDFEAMRKHTFLFSNDGKPISNESVMKEALLRSTAHDFLLLVHEEPECEMIERDLFLQRKYGGHLHLCHVSLKDSVDLIRAHKKAGFKVSAEVTAHHLYASGVDYKVHPPFRTEKDREALLEGVMDGTIDCLGTDHAPHTQADKEKGAPGLLAYPFAVSMVLNAFQEAGIGMDIFSLLTHQNPARILGRRPMRMQQGEDADLVLINIEEKYEANLSHLESKSKNFPFEGDLLQGKIYMTMRKGEIRYADRSFI